MKSVCAAAGHNGSNYRSEEFDFEFARDTYYDSILHAAKTRAAQGKKFDLHADVTTDGIFHNSCCGHLSYEQGQVTLDFWPLDNGDPVYLQFNASTKGVLDCISLIYGGFISACHTFTPDDINLQDPELSDAHSLFNSNPSLRETIKSIAERESTSVAKKLNSVLQEAMARSETAANDISALPKEQGR